MATEASLKKIIDDILKVDGLKIDSSRTELIRGFLASTVNGDDIKADLTIDANISDKKLILVYILTNLRLIKIEIDEKEISAASFFLNTMTGFERKLIDGERASTQVSFQGGTIGLRYPSSSKKITEFFQLVDQSRPVGVIH